MAAALALTPAALAKDTTKADLAKLVKAQFDGYATDKEGPPVYADGAMMAMVDAANGADGLIEAENATSSGAEAKSYKRRTDKNLDVGLARDGNTAWISFTSKIHYKHGKMAGLDEFDTEYRITELAVKTPKGWRIDGGMWSTAAANAEVNKSAKAGKQSEMNGLEPSGGDKSLMDAFTTLTTGPFDATAAARPTLIGFGSGPGERTTKGAVLAKAWAGSWANHLTIDGPMAAPLAPSGTTGWVIANVTLDKTSHKVHFRVLFVFDKDASGAWSLVHAHFATFV
jgi:hypothetical protein